MQELVNKPFQLSDHAKKVIEERNINLKWIEYVLSNPLKRIPDSDDPELEHAIQKIKEYDNRVLRVIYNKKVSPKRIVTAYFDRTFRGKI